MNMLKTLFAVLALSFSLNSLAITDDEQVEFSDGLTEGTRSRARLPASGIW